ncbi:phage terminase small subunit [Marinomonas sp.]|uniref:phage terminase small subunit n=1 Tax=Marinomonas sp. TaxID=1904862 RepID=UPI003BAD8CA1
MATLQQIKQAQIEAAKKAGKPNPYAKAEKLVAKAAKQIMATGKQMGKLAALKAKQLEANPDAYGVKPTIIGADMADGDDSTSTTMIGGVGKHLFEQLQAAMVTDVARIKTKPELEDKQALKGELLPNYLPFVQAYVADGHDYPNDVAVQVMVWLFDVNDIDNALKIGMYLVATGNNDLPPKFSRNLPTFIADALYDWANAELKAEQTATPYLDALVDFVDDALAEKWDLHPAVISKNLSLLAKHKEREGKLAECVALCEKAETANPEGAGVKTMKERVQKLLDKSVESSDEETNE